VAGTDPVVWHCFGISHAVRVEDFPVMPVEHVGFKLKAANFFTGNPAVDIPPTVATATSSGAPCHRVSASKSRF